MKFIYLSEALRMLLRRIKVFFSGINRYSGNDEEICIKIIKDCFNEKQGYFMVSNGHFCEFYARDFGLCVEALISLGYKKQVFSTLDHVLSAYKKAGMITQSISPQGVPFTFPDKYSPDALAFIIRSLRLAKARSLVKRYRGFLNKEIRKYFEIVIDQSSGMVKKDAKFSSLKDHYFRNSSCYDNVMIAMLSSDLTYFKELINPFRKYDYKSILVRNFWSNNFFLDDLSGRTHVAGDANIIPFWSGVITDKRLFSKALKSIQKDGLDKPFPLKYSSRKVKSRTAFEDVFLPSYETDSVWAHLGMMFIRTIAFFDKGIAKKYLLQYKKLILGHGNFLELYDKQGRAFQSLFYYSDEGMLWCANYLFLKKKLF